MVKIAHTCFVKKYTLRDTSKGQVACLCEKTNAGSGFGVGTDTGRSRHEVLGCGRSPQHDSRLRRSNAVVAVLGD